MKIESLCTYLAKHIIPDELLTDQYIEVISYGLCALFTNCINLLLLLVLSFVCGLIRYTLSFCILYIPLRIFHKGYHCQTFLHCVILTSLSFMICSYLIKIVPYHIIMFPLFFLLIFIHYHISKEKNLLITTIYIIIFMMNFLLQLHLDIVFLLSLLLNILSMKGGDLHE